MTLPTSSPLAEDIDPAGLLAFLEGLADDDDVELHSLAVARHGRVVARGWAAPYAPDRVHLGYSLSKTLTTTAVAFLEQEGRLDLDDAVVDLLGGSAPDDVDPRWSAVRLRHCLSMTVGHHDDAWPRVVDRADLASMPPDEDLVARVLSLPPAGEPGRVFAYNQVATYLVSVVVDRLAGGVRTVLRPRLLDPLGIDEIPWHTDPQGRELGFTGAHLRTADLLALAQFVLDRGSWEGRRLLREAWFDQAASAVAPPDPDREPDWSRGYGFGFWMQRHGHRGDGAFGQFLVVLPEHDVVVVVTSEQERMQATLDLLWEHVVPAIDRPGDPADERALDRALDGLAIPPRTAAGPGRATVAFERAGGDLPRSWASATAAGTDGGHVLVLVRDGVELPVAVGDGNWLASDLRADGWVLPVVASGGWQGDRFVAEVRPIETPHVFLARAARGGGLDLRWRRPPLTGPDPFALAVRRADRPAG